MRCSWPSCLSKRIAPLHICHYHVVQVYDFMEARRREDVGILSPEPPPKPARSKPHERHGWVYYVEIHGRLKIGFASNVEQRIRSYPPGSVLLAQKRGTMADEKAEHQRCTPWRISGREWYELNDSTRRVVDEARRAEADKARAEYEPPPRPGYNAA